MVCVHCKLNTLLVITAPFHLEFALRSALARTIRVTIFQVSKFSGNDVRQPASIIKKDNSQKII
jgi:hypothetical protein